MDAQIKMPNTFFAEMNQAGIGNRLPSSIIIGWRISRNDLIRVSESRIGNIDLDIDAVIAVIIALDTWFGGRYFADRVDLDITAASIGVGSDIAPPMSLTCRS